MSNVLTVLRSVVRSVIALIYLGMKAPIACFAESHRRKDLLDITS